MFNDDIGHPTEGVYGVSLEMLGKCAADTLTFTKHLNQKGPPGNMSRQDRPAQGVQASSSPEEKHKLPNTRIKKTLGENTCTNSSTKHQDELSSQAKNVDILIATGLHNAQKINTTYPATSKTEHNTLNSSAFSFSTPALQ